MLLNTAHVMADASRAHGAKTAQRDQLPHQAQQSMSCVRRRRGSYLKGYNMWTLLYSFAEF